MNYRNFESVEELEQSKFWACYVNESKNQEVHEESKIIDDSLELIDNQAVIDESNKIDNQVSTEEHINNQSAVEDFNKIEEQSDETRLKSTHDDPEDVTSNGNKPIKKIVYADLDQKNSCIFKNIIVFTNDKTDNNKTLVNIKDAIKDLKSSDRPELYVFAAATCAAENEGRILYISDEDQELKIDGQTNVDTLIFSRLGVQGEVCCEDAIKQLQDRGFLVLNPVRYSEIASNKLMTATLLEQANLPQPRYTGMKKDIMQDEKLFTEAIQRIYPDYKPGDDEKNKEREVVIKILDGHGGIGVFQSDCKHMVAILQTIFAIDEGCELIIQKKEQGDGGDIRVHVLTLKDKQIILGAMKREQISGDFRSNVSLGGKVKKIKLTKEQEQIALSAAQISKLPWAAIDIMPLVKGSDPEVGDNVILEINASPGTEGISEVLKKNFINIILNELDDPSDFILQDKNAGYVESARVWFSDDFSKEYLAKLDTGNSGIASTLEVGEFKEENGYIHFSVDGHKFKFKKEKDAKYIVGDETVYRPVIMIPMVQIGQRKIKNTYISLVKDRSKKTTNMLINRHMLGALGYVVHPSAAHILTDSMEKVKILN